MSKTCKSREKQSRLPIFEKSKPTAQFLFKQAEIPVTQAENHRASGQGSYNA
jgi:hypothetical protein